MRPLLRALVCILLVPVALLARAAAFDPFREAGIDQRPGASVPIDGRFRDAHGGETTLRRLSNGKPILLAPVLHRCPNICGVTLSGLAQAIRAQSYRPGGDFAVVAFGIDPREGPEAARDSLETLARSFPAVRQAGWSALTGDKRAITEVTEAIGYRYAWDEQIHQYAHVAAVAVLTPDGRLARWIYGLQPDPTDLRLALTEAGEGKIGSWGDQLLLLCYHYDPKTGRYGPVITWLLRLGGSLTVLLGTGMLGLSVLRERRAARETRR